MLLFGYGNRAEDPSETGYFILFSLLLFLGDICVFSGTIAGIIGAGTSFNSIYIFLVLEEIILIRLNN